MDTIISKKKKVRNTLLVGGLFLLLLLFGVIYIISVSRSHTDIQVNENRVGIDTVITGVFYDQMVFEGIVKPESHVEILLPDDFNKKIMVKPGQSVRKGDTIALFYKNEDSLQLLNAHVEAFLEKLQKLNNKEYRAAIPGDDKMKAIEKLRAAITREDIELIMKKTWGIKGFIDSISLDTGQPDEDLPDTDALNKLLTEVQNTLSAEFVTAPGSGTIVMANRQKSITSSEMQSTPFLITSDSVFVEAILDRTQLLRLKMNTVGEVIFSCDTLKASISQIDTSGEKNYGIVHFRFSDYSPEISDLLKKTKISLSLGKRDSTLLLPRGSFMQYTGGKWVYVVNDNIAVRRAITLGRGNMHYHEVLEGLSEGDKVITSGYAAFRDVEKFRIVKNEKQ